MLNCKVRCVGDHTKNAIYEEPQSSPIQDSGNRREFETGAVRDMQEGKGRCDLLPAAAILRLARHFENGCKKLVLSLSAGPSSCGIWRYLLW